MNSPSRSTLIKSLKKLLRQSLDPSGSNFQITFYANSHQETAIRMAALSEYSLRGVLETKMQQISTEQRNGIFDDKGPLYDFSSKISIAHAFGLIGDATKSNLGIIREIRNAFAHCLVNISFQTKEIGDLCGHLNYQVYDESQIVAGAIDKYILTCGLISTSFTKGQQPV